MDLVELFNGSPGPFDLEGSPDIDGEAIYLDLLFLIRQPQPEFPEGFGGRGEICAHLQFSRSPRGHDCAMDSIRYKYNAYDMIVRW